MCSSFQMPTSPGVIRPSAVTALASTTTSPAGGLPQPGRDQDTPCRDARPVGEQDPDGAHRARRREDSQLSARIASFELANELVAIGQAFESEAVELESGQPP